MSAAALRRARKYDDAPGASRPHVVVIGAGFAGLSAVRALAKAAVRITLVDRQNHHLFQPLLYQVATAGLSPSHIAMPIRSILSAQRNVTVLLGEVTDIDAEGKTVLVGMKNIRYDILVVATGARHSYFGRDDWTKVALSLKRIEDAIDMRRQILLSFERAENSEDPAQRNRLLNFVIVGGGPTGVELAGV